ncbi:MAG: hypothetical protein WBF03_06515 [Xanthobacteraceae bacterium]
MLARHTNEVMNRLEQVVDLGCATVRKHELLVWFGQERVTVNIWRDLQEKWQEVLETQGEKLDTPLLVGEAEGVWTFAWGEGLTTSDSSWFKNVTDLRKRSLAERLEEYKQNEGVAETIKRRKIS